MVREHFTTPESIPTFAEAVEWVFDTLRSRWTSASYARQWKRFLERWAYPVIGNLQVIEVTTAHILAILEPMRAEYPETSRRVIQGLRTVFGWTIAQSWRVDNPADKTIYRILARRSELAKRSKLAKQCRFDDKLREFPIHGCSRGPAASP